MRDAPQWGIVLTCDLLVIGAGAFGAWTALEMRRAGKSVRLVDAWGPAHARASSGGESRIIRMGYGADEIYTRMAVRSLARWREILHSAGEPLFHRTGVLWLARAGDPYSEATRATLDAAGVRSEILPFAEMAVRYPQMRLADTRIFGILEPESGALMARRAIAFLVRELVRRGGTYQTAAVEPPAGRGRLAGVRTSDGETISAGDYVFACGAWLPKVFPGILQNRIHPTRQEVFFFAPPRGDRQFSPAHLPVWIDFADPRAPYGFPDLEGRGCKVGFDRHGPAYDPDSQDRRVSDRGAEEARSFLDALFPAMRDAPLTETRVCQYENTSNGDFLIDRHPDWENVWLAAGGSGHGFKHGPAVAEHLRARILEGAAAEPRFALAGKIEARQRTVH